MLLQPEHIPLHRQLWERQARALQRHSQPAQQQAAAARATAAAHLAPLKEQPGFVAGAPLHPHQLSALNWLRERWAGGRHAIFADHMVSVCC